MGDLQKNQNTKRELSLPFKSPFTDLHGSAPRDLNSTLSLRVEKAVATFTSAIHHIEFPIFGIAKGEEGVS
jgi:hypothetical protein